MAYAVKSCVTKSAHHYVFNSSCLITTMHKQPQQASDQHHKVRLALVLCLAVHHPKLKLLWPPGVFLPEEESPAVPLLLLLVSPKERLLPPPGGLRTPPMALRGCSLVEDPKTMLPDISFFFSSETCMGGLFRKIGCKSRIRHDHSQRCIAAGDNTDSTIQKPHIYTGLQVENAVLPKEFSSITRQQYCSLCSLMLTSQRGLSRQYRSC